MAGTPKQKPRHYPAKDMKWLELRGRTYYAVQAVPRSLRVKFGGKKRLLKSLGTREHHQAIRLRHTALADFKRQFDRAEVEVASGAVVQEALVWRDTLDRLERGDESAFSVMGAPDGASAKDVARWVLDDQADEIESEQGLEAAREFLGIARGMATPLLLHVDSWLKEGGSKGPLNPRTRAQYQSAINDLSEWAQGIGIRTIEGVSNQVAGRYVTQELVAKGVHWATGNRRIAAASSYWRWLRKRAGITANPWAGQSLAKGTRRTDEHAKRPFTDDEVTTLLAGDADAELADVMRIAALSGMRLEEVYRLAVRDCADGWFNIRRAKTRAGVRRVPIHSHLTEIVDRRAQNKEFDAYLFHEAGVAQEGRERSMAVSKRFGRYRQTVAVHDRADGVRHSRVDFHSWRRWFVTAARNAGIDRAVVAAVVGHEVGNLTDDTYSGGPSEALLRACVEAVRLPSRKVAGGPGFPPNHTKASKNRDS